MSNEEEDPKIFLVRILNTLAIVLLWMIVNIFIGLYLNYGFFEEVPNWKNYTYYVFLLVSFIFLVIHLKRKWRL